MRGVAQVTRSQTGKDNVITQIRRDLAPILAKGPLSAKTVEMVQFILRGAHDLKVRMEYLGLSPQRVGEYLQAVMSGVPSGRDVSAHKELAERLQDIFTLLPDDAVRPGLELVFKELHKQAVVGAAKDQYLIHLSPFVGAANQPLKDLMKEAAIRLIEGPSQFARPFSEREPVCEALAHLQADGQLQGRDLSAIQQQLMSRIESAETGAPIQGSLHCFGTLGIRLGPSDVTRIADRILSRMGVENRDAEQLGLAKALAAIPADVPDDVIRKALNCPLCVGEARRALLSRTTGDAQLQANVWRWLGSRGEGVASRR
jgi:hypothetical protein